MSPVHSRIFWIFEQNGWPGITSNQHWIDCQAIVTGVKTAGSWRAFRDDKTNPWRAYAARARKAVLRLRSLVALASARRRPTPCSTPCSPVPTGSSGTCWASGAHAIPLAYLLTLAIFVARGGNVKRRALQLRRLRVVAARPGPRRQRAERARPRRAPEDGDGAVGDLVARRVLAALRVVALRAPEPALRQLEPDAAVLNGDCTLTNR